MKKKLTIALLACMLVTPLQAYEGEMGYFGGISPGYKLPTATMLAQDKLKTPSSITLPYKENIYLTGKAIPVEGTLQIKPQVLNKEKPTGTYTETYIIKAESGDSKVTRTITLDTTYVYDEVTKQATKTSTVKKWTELVVVEGVTYQLQEKDSHFSKSIIEDYTPGVTYYRGDVSYESVYVEIGNEAASPLRMQVNGPIYGYEHAYAKTETQKRNIFIASDAGSYYIEETPTYTTHKEMQYGANEPGAISFAGNYKEILRGEGANLFRIQVGNPALYDDEKQGSFATVDVPSLEQLPAVGLNHLKGHPAETDLRKMYSMKIFTGPSYLASPNEVVTRGAYIEMLVRALRIPVEQTETKKTFSFGASKTEETVAPVFTDVDKDDALYPYMMAAYKAGLIGGGTLNPGKYLERQEMIELNVAAIGLQRLGIATGGVYTPFIDDALIDQDAKIAVYAASRIGLINGEGGYIYPNKKVTMADAATFLNQMIDYLRYELRTDYDEKIMM